MSWYLSMSCYIELRTHSWTTLKGSCCRSFPTMQQARKVVTPVTAASSFNTSDRQGEKWKKANCSTILKRITNYKSENSESDWRIDSFPWGSLVGLMSSCRRDMSHTLESKQLPEFWCGVYRSCKRHQHLNLTWREFSGRWDLAADAPFSCTNLKAQFWLDIQ